MKRCILIHLACFLLFAVVDLVSATSSWGQETSSRKAEQGDRIDLTGDWRTPAWQDNYQEGVSMTTHEIRFRIEQRGSIVELKTVGGVVTDYSSPDNAYSITTHGVSTWKKTGRVLTLTKTSFRSSKGGSGTVADFPEPVRMTISRDGNTITKQPLGEGEHVMRLVRQPDRPAVATLPNDQVTDRVRRFRGEIDELVDKNFPHMKGKRVLENFRDFDRRPFYFNVYQCSQTVKCSGSEYRFIERLLISYDDRGKRSVCSVPRIIPVGVPTGPKQPKPKERPPLRLEPLKQMPEGCVVLTDLARLKVKHGDSFDEIRAYVESFGPVIDLNEAGVALGDWQAVDRLIERRFDRKKSGCLFIFGNHDVVPFCQYDNPLYGTQMDTDKVIYSDDPYADFDHDKHNDWEIMVTRLPDDTGILSAESSIVRRQGENPSGYRRFAVYANQNRPAGEVLAKLGKPLDPRLRQSLPSTEDDFSNSCFSGHNLFLIFHGSDQDGTRYWGEAIRKGNDDANLVTAMNISQADMSGAVIVSSCCYGASIQNKDSDNCIALRFLRNGARAYIGHTMTSYSDLNEPTARLAGLWGKLLLQYTKQGASPQESLMAAKRSYAQTVDSPMQFKAYHQVVYLGLPPLLPRTSGE